MFGKASVGGEGQSTQRSIRIVAASGQKKQGELALPAKFLQDRGRKETERIPREHSLTGPPKGETSVKSKVGGLPKD